MLSLVVFLSFAAPAAPPAKDLPVAAGVKLPVETAGTCADGSCGLPRSGRAVAAAATAPVARLAEAKPIRSFFGRVFGKRDCGCR